MRTTWVSVRTARTRADVALPGDLPVADLTPGLQDLLGSDGHLVSAVGSPLDPRRPIADQVADGSVLVLAPEPGTVPVVVQDDPALVAADTVARAPAWSVTDTRLGLRVAALTAALVGWVAVWLTDGPLVAGVAALGCGVVGFAGPGVRVLPLVIVGAVLTAVSVVEARFGLDASLVLVLVAALLVVAASSLPGAALGLSAPGSHARADPSRLVGDVARARELQLALTAGVLGVLVLAAVRAPSLGWSGIALVAVSSGLVLLRTRRHVVRPEVAVGVIGGGAALATLAVCVLLSRPEWGHQVLVSTAVAAGVSVLPHRPSVRLARCLDVAETLALVAIPGLVVVAARLPEVVR